MSFSKLMQKNLKLQSSHNHQRKFNLSTLERNNLKFKRHLKSIKKLKILPSLMTFSTNNNSKKSLKNKKSQRNQFKTSMSSSKISKNLKRKIKNPKKSHLFQEVIHKRWFKICLEFKILRNQCFPLWKLLHKKPGQKLTLNFFKIFYQV